MACQTLPWTDHCLMRNTDMKLKQLNTHRGTHEDQLDLQNAEREERKDDEWLLSLQQSRYNIAAHATLFFT